MAENNAYKLKLFQDETARGLARLYEAGYLPNDRMGEVSLRDAESGLVFISIKPGTFYIAEPRQRYRRRHPGRGAGHHRDAAKRTPGLTSGRVQGPPGRARHPPHLSRVVLPVLRARRIRSLCAG